MKKRENKKGLEIATTTIVTIILLVLTMAIILFFYNQLNYSSVVDREVCHQSVIFRATLPAFGGTKEFVPLKCKTEKVCITSKLFGQNCLEYENTKGVTKVRVSDLVDVEKTISQQVLDCWTMMGEGKVSIFSQWLAERYGLGSVYPSCVICSRIAFDRTSLEKNRIDLSKANVGNYMLSRLVPNKEFTYYDYIAGEGGKTKVSETLFSSVPTQVYDSALAKAEGELATYGSELEKVLKEKEDLSQAEKDILAKVQTINAALEKRKENKILSAEENELLKSYDEIGYSAALPLVNPATQTEVAVGGEIAVVFMQITAPEQWKSLVNIGTDLLVAGTAVSQVPGGGVVLGKVGKACGAYPVICAVVGVGVGVGAVVTQQIFTANMRSTAAGYCGDISVGSEARNGCSVVRAIKYDEAELQKTCVVIESIS